MKPTSNFTNDMSRRMMLRRLLAGTLSTAVSASSIAAILGTEGCSEPTTPYTAVTIDTSTDPGILNICYALLQLEADFYSRLVRFPFISMTSAQQTTFGSYQSTTVAARNALRLSQKIHRISDVLLFQFSAVIAFPDKTSVLQGAQVISEATANGYLGAQELASPGTIQTQIGNYATAAGLRATGVRDMLLLPPFSPAAVTPADTIHILEPYYLTPITVTS